MILLLRLVSGFECIMASVFYPKKYRLHPQQNEKIQIIVPNKIGQKNAIRTLDAITTLNLTAHAIRVRLPQPTFACV